MNMLAHTTHIMDDKIGRINLDLFPRLRAMSRKCIQERHRRSPNPVLPIHT